LETFPLSRGVVQDEWNVKGRDCFRHEVHSHGLDATIRLVTQSIQDLRESSVQKHAKTGQSINVVVGLVSATIV